MLRWLKEFSSSPFSLSVPAPYFSVICYYEFWTQHVARSNCIVSTDHFCCIFTTDAGSSAHTSRLNEIRGIGFHLPLLNWPSSCMFPQQPVTQHLKSTLGVTVSVHPLYSLWDCKRGGAFSYCTLQSSPKHTSQKGTQHNTVWCIQTARNSATTMHHNQQHMCMNLQTVSQICCTQHNATNHN